MSRAEIVIVTERVYERLADGRVVLAATEGDVVLRERAEQLGLVGKGQPLTQPPLREPLLREGPKPLDGRRNTRSRLRSRLPRYSTYVRRPTLVLVALVP